MLVLLVQQIVGRKLKFEASDVRWVPPPPAERTLGAAGPQRGRVAAAEQPKNGRNTAATRVARARSVRQLLAARPSLGDAGLVKRASALAVLGCRPPAGPRCLQARVCKPPPSACLPACLPVSACVCLRCLTGSSRRSTFTHTRYTSATRTENGQGGGGGGGGGSGGGANERHRMVPV